MPEFIIRAEETDLFFLFKHYKELIRCKDCVYHGSVTIGNRVSLTNFCSRLNDCTGEEEFCSRAERKDKNDGKTTD